MYTSLITIRDRDFKSTSPGTTVEQYNRGPSPMPCFFCAGGMQKSTTGDVLFVGLFVVHGVSKKVQQGTQSHAMLFVVPGVVHGDGPGDVPGRSPKISFVAN
jgi:hypothetical protein